MNALIFLTLVLTSTAAKLPSYIKPCKRGATFRECAIKNGQDAIPSIVKGDRAYKIPNMLPLKIPRIYIDAPSLKINLQDNDIHGLDKSIVKDLDFDFDKQHFKVSVYVPLITLIGQYEIDGKILVLPLRGKGPSNITFSDCLFNYDYDYKLYEKNGEMYQNITKHELKYDVSGAHFQLDNLFDGNKRLGEEMNVFLNENWMDVIRDIGPALGDTFSQIITTILSEIIKRIPNNELFVE